MFDGARNVLEKNRPVILSELSDCLLKQNGSSSTDVIRMIKEYDYDVVDPLDPDVPPSNEDFGDILCVPR